MSFILSLKEESVVSFLMLAGKVFHNFAPLQRKELWYLVVFARGTRIRSLFLVL